MGRHPFVTNPTLFTPIPIRDAAADRLAIFELYEGAAGSSARRGYRPRRGMFLVAAPGLPDPRFARTVILLEDRRESRRPGRPGHALSHAAR